MDQTKPIQISDDLVGFAISPKEDCLHFNQGKAGALKSFIESKGNDIFKTKCNDCENIGENWICVICQEVFCSRFVNSHMVGHYEKEKHGIALSFLDFSFWCYECESYITNPQLKNFQKCLSAIRFNDESDVNKLSQQIQNLAISQSSKPETISLENVIEGLKNKTFKNVFFLTGAGISVAAGIPDFRSPGTGLYSQLEQYKLPYPEAIFELTFYKNKPDAFYKLAKEFLLKFKGTPVKAHKFIKKMDDEGLLKLCFTQNIDSLELEAGLDEQKLIQAHGHLRTAHCIRCNQEQDSKKWFQYVEKEEVMKCSDCEGLVKPDVVFFGENLPLKFLTHMNDIKTADLVIIMGTALQVLPFSRLPLMINNKNVPILLINRENCLEGSYEIKDQIVFMKGDIEENVQKLCNEIGWQL